MALSYGIGTPLIILVEMTRNMEASAGPGPAPLAPHLLFISFHYLIASADALLVSDKPVIV